MTIMYFSDSSIYCLQKSSGILDTTEGSWTLLPKIIIQSPWGKTINWCFSEESQVVLKQGTGSIGRKVEVVDGYYEKVSRNDKETQSECLTLVEELGKAD